MHIAFYTQITIICSIQIDQAESKVTHIKNLFHLQMLTNLRKILDIIIV